MAVGAARAFSNMSEWHIYLIRTGDGSLYAGVTTDVARRFSEHRADGGRCARYLRGKAPLQLVFKKRLGSRSLALKAESRIRKLPKHRKEQIVRSNPSRRKLVEQLFIFALTSSVILSPEMSMAAKPAFSSDGPVIWTKT